MTEPLIKLLIYTFSWLKILQNTCGHRSHTPFLGGGCFLRYVSLWIFESNVFACVFVCTCPCHMMSVCVCVCLPGCLRVSIRNAWTLRLVLWSKLEITFVSSVIHYGLQNDCSSRSATFPSCLITPCTQTSKAKSKKTKSTETFLRNSFISLP